MYLLIIKIFIDYIGNIYVPKKYTKSKNNTFRIFFCIFYIIRQILHKNYGKICKTKDKSLNNKR